jgi:preprotein translocase subunit SecA
MLGLDIAFRRVFGTRADRLIRGMQPVIARINDLEPGLQALSDEALRGKTGEFRQRLDNGASLDDLLPDAFAVVREAGRRTMNMRHFNVQLVGGMVIHRGMVAEMKTGEGKTLVATAPVYLNALGGKGVHVVTVNDYLAMRDAEWMGRIYRFLGLSVGTILSNERNEGIKRAAYAADITYGTNNEFGFDYLRDNMKFRLEDMVQRGHNFAIVDEVDSILIDEARTPLIISGPTNDSIDQYYVIDQIVPLLQKDLDFTVDEKSRAVSLTDEGVDKVEARLGVGNLFETQNMEALHHVNQALKAHFVFKRDKDYVVSDGKVVIVDEHTGRLMQGRRWSDGLHQAVEAKERVKIEAESQTYATITFQNYFRMYGKLAGMTGTADTEAEEFGNIYKLEVVPIPTNRSVQRVDHHDIVYKTQREKFERVLQELEECYARKQPVLVGTTSVEKSELVARMLQKKGIPHEVLNAKNHAREAEIVAQAGRLGAITISTNMAGRGTDIKLGGDPEGLARLALVQRAQAGDPEATAILADLQARTLKGAPPPTPGADNPVWAALLAETRAQVDVEREQVMKAGGLHILGTERHESRRIDNQLRGRSGRQGDPGSSRFYLSLEDDLLRIFGSDKIIVWMERMGLEDDEPIEHRWITASIENAQKKVEGHNFNIRKNLLEYDDVMNLQRKAVYELRRRALHGENIRDMMLESLEALVADILDETVAEGLKHEDWDTPALLRRLEEVFDVRWTETPEQLREFAREEIREKVLADVRAAYAAKEAELGDSGMRQVERMLVLQFADQLWKDHLLALDRLRDGIGLRGYAQRNPLLEYKKEAFGMFQMMNSLRDEAVLSRLLRMRFESAPPQDDSGASLDESDDDVPGMVDDDAMEAFATREDAVIFEPAPRPALPEKGPEARLFAVQHGLRRNDPCPCGSGQKFKKCCYEEAEVTALTARFAAAMEAEAQAEAARLASLQDTDGGGVAEGVSPSAEEGETSNDAPADVVDAVFATPSGETTA